MFVWLWPPKDYGLELWGVKKLDSVDCNLQSSREILHTVTVKVQLYHDVFIIYLIACGQKIKYPIKAKGDWLKRNDCKLHVGNRMWTNVFFKLILRKHQTTPDLAHPSKSLLFKDTEVNAVLFLWRTNCPCMLPAPTSSDATALYSLPTNTIICLLCLSKSGIWKGYSICIKQDFIMDCGFLVLWHHLAGDNRSR